MVAKQGCAGKARDLKEGRHTATWGGGGGGGVLGGAK